MSESSSELESLREELRALRAQVERPRRVRARLLVAALALTSTFAVAQLVTFSADTPARASEVNGNFNQLKAWLEAKVGLVTENFITTPSVVVRSAGAGAATLTSTASAQLALSNGLALPDGAGIQSTRLGVSTPVVNLNTNTFAGGFLEGTFTDTGGSLVIMASATGFCTSTGRITMNVRLDGTVIGAMRVFCQSINTHMAFPATFLRVNRAQFPQPAAPVTRTVRLEPINCTSGCSTGLVTTFVDLNDFGEVTVLRLPTP